MNFNLIAILTEEQMGKKNKRMLKKTVWENKPSLDILCLLFHLGLIKQNATEQMDADFAIRGLLSLPRYHQARN